MKSLKKEIRIMILLTALITSISVNAQSETIKYNIYLRVYNLEGKKISKGALVFINDSLIELKNSIKQSRVSFNDIGFIRTKKSASNNVVIGAVSGATLGAVVGVSTADPDDWIFSYTKGEGALVLGGIGALGGSAIGGITSLFKKSKTYIINGDVEKWRIFKEKIVKSRFY
ncbi:glycine zipper family protein [Thalassobellus suaedae]|uniref:Glycine zipper family protein n=1 Tax=Thalassobellus suaedae TaxID=3074124 RepID=A0ABY9XZB9_9FLAO|nr:hypothetical protein RHP49_10405 [Flavobacteriaceae bacterium HL-DH10]